MTTREKITHFTSYLESVIPAKAGIYKVLKTLDSRLRGSDNEFSLLITTQEKTFSVIPAFPTVIPAKAGIYKVLKTVDFRLHGSDNELLF